VANGEVWTVADAERCLQESGCDALMLGRGLVGDPGLALALRGRAGPPWPVLLGLLRLYGRLITPRVAPRHRGGRLKQWLNMLRKSHPGAQLAYEAVRELNDAALIDERLAALEATLAPTAVPQKE
jgi:tRNA-dihydrouridine synthase C